MRIALVSLSCDNTTGVGRVVSSLARQFAGSGHQVDVVAQHIDEPGHGVRSVLLASVPGPRSLSRVFFGIRSHARLARGGYDITNSFGVGRGGMVVTAGSCHRAAVELQSRYRAGRVARRGLGIFDAVSLREERVLMRPAATRMVIAVSRLVREQISRYYEFPQDRIRVIPNGIDIDTAPSPGPGERPTLRRQVGLSGSDYALLMVGNEFDRKGLQTIIEAMAILRDDRVKLLVVGSDAPAPYLKMAGRLGLSSRIRFLGSVDNPGQYFGIADIFVLPTWYEPFGIAIIEAMWAGLPVITSAAAGAVEDMTDGRHGLFLADPLSANELASAIRRLMDDESLRTTIAAAGRDEVRRFSWSRIADETLSAYNDLLAAEGRLA